MNDKTILLIEDNPKDEALTLRALRKQNIGNQGYNLGANSYVCKPVDFIQFADAVRQLGLFWLIVNEPPLPVTGA